MYPKSYPRYAVIEPLLLPLLLYWSIRLAYRNDLTIS